MSKSPLWLFFFLATYLIALTPTFSQFDSAPRNIQINVEMQTVAGVSRGLYQNIQRSNQTQMLVVLEGYEAKLTIGRRVPYVTWFRDYLTGEGYLTGDIQFLHVGTSLVVTARVIGNQIEVNLTPEISYETRDGTGSVQVSSLSTRVRVPNGQSVEIGSVTNRTEFADRFYTRDSGESVSIRLTPRVMEAY